MGVCWRDCLLQGISVPLLLMVWMCFHEASWQILLESAHLSASCLAQNKAVYSFFSCSRSLQIKYFHRFLDSNTESHSCEDHSVCLRYLDLFEKTNVSQQTHLLALCGLFFASTPMAQNCFFRISLGLFLCFPTLCILSGLYVWCVYICLSLVQFA